MALRTMGCEADLEDLIVDASRGDVDAFMRFYDATSDYAFGLALARARAQGMSELRAREAAESEAQRRFVKAWENAGRYRPSGLSPLTWLLSMDLPCHEADTYSSKEEPCPL